MNIDKAELASLSPDSTFFVFNPCFQIIFFSRPKLRATASCVFVVRKTVFSFDNQVTNLLLRDESPQKRVRSIELGGLCLVFAQVRCKGATLWRQGPTMLCPQSGVPGQRRNTVAQMHLRHYVLSARRKDAISLYLNFSLAAQRR